ncbi:MAG: DUF3795 domain-containing protein [Candidatus Abyssubacteria bacterium]|nr:DUF3795 domain-containing protein [Candidatus Abyssubacteria bacterium]
MTDQNLAPVCGLYCGTCKYLGNQCRGCGYEKGKPFWTSAIGVEVCPLYDCCINTKRLEHCGLCDELPCETYLGLWDPALSPEEAEESLRMRQKALLRRKEIGTDKWLEEIGERPIS